MAMNERYEPQAIEGKWQARWEEAGVFRAGARPEAPKKYVLEMLPYPSGAMHMGHVRNYLIGDVYARYYRMLGFDVLHPMGWDALGLPAENAAIKDGVHPAIRTRDNIASFKREMKTLGYSYDWTREVNTSEPEYYRWNQWFFIKMLERDMVYRRFSKVNWCTGCHTVIANEQVKEGRCERCDSPVHDKEMPEWAFRITRDSQALLDGLDTLTQWPERITSMQRHWIGRSEGAEAEFAVQGSNEKIRIFTTRIDTVYGCTYVVLAPEHRLVKGLTTPEQAASVQAFVAKMAAMSKTDRTQEGAEKEGVFTGSYAVNPFTGKPVPIWIANFVLADYGTGAVMSVPAHDERDFAFARKYALPLRVVVQGEAQQKAGEPVPDAATLEAALTEDGILVDSGEFTGLPSADARRRMSAQLEAKGQGKATVTYRQKDWGFSRQRYWGTPIPIIYCEKCDPERKGIPVPLDQLPVRQPEIDVQAVLTGKGEPPLAKVPEFVNTTCPTCGGPARREVETMDTFVDSCWYYARYLSPHYDQAPFDPKEAQRWLPVDIYVGGPEHAVMHLLYFRFWSRQMKQLGLTPVDEPVTRLITQGIVNGPDGRKMSKRWGNSVAPASIVQKYGADTARTYVLFAGPPERDFDWSDDQVEGAHRFLKRVWVLAQTHVACADAKHEGSFEGKALETRRIAHKCVKRVGEAIERLSFNTAIAGVMECVNALYQQGTPETPAERAAMAEAIRLLAAVLTPFAPHIADEIAEAYGARAFTVTEAWPTFDPALVVDDVIPYAVQVNGKLRAEVRAPVDATEAQVRALAEAEEKVQSALAGKTLRKVVFVPKRLLNLVVG
ncbi:leucine--tRNA ligase [Aggregicoccus sp. 17bor-14]|uniref:leucine--tRNA ligase n=1 Tax=Myxococcaceae TaxID=31 RepID=UPI00129C34B9|nr:MULTISPECIES: leucine--tRNA ligase [Myxococcaceae]MBF5046347.1 leucine--tRNA ligase [Simulacricoccus sp. 17bor-14]MRI92067.1 leucine--tRNA ligase [Aggregicoccus sp. 17bor-14]